MSNLQVVTSTAEEVFFKIKRNTKLSKLQAAYANKVGKDVGSIRYVHESHPDHHSWTICFRHGGLIVFSPSVPLNSTARGRAIWGIRRFLYDGNRINDDDTPASLDMDDNGQSNPCISLSSEHHFPPCCVMLIQSTLLAVIQIQSM